LQEFIKSLDLEGADLKADAMHCERETAKAVMDKKTDYILIVNGNQPPLTDE
jgi:predicted transposase YbfD/YdcC